MNKILEQLLSYSFYRQETGQFIRTALSTGPQTQQQIGKPLGWDNCGYLRISIANKQYLIAHLVWFIETGHMPQELDHIDGDRTNNRFHNLREVTAAQNARNKAKYSNNSSGYTGITFEAGRYRSRVKFNGTTKHLGRFDTIEDAIMARKKFLYENQHLGFTKRHGK